MSSPGSSNKKIWHNIINFKFKDGDIVFILWSLSQRYSFYENKKTVFDIGNWMIESDPKSKSYYRYLYSKYDSELQSKLFVNHTNLYLKEKKIKVYNMIIEKEERSILSISNIRQNHIPIYISDNYLHFYPKALDNTHPGVEAHLAFAKDILSYLDIKNTISVPIQKRFCLIERTDLLTTRYYDAIVRFMTEEDIELYKDTLYAVMWFIAMNWMAVLSIFFVVLYHFEIFN